MLRFWTSLAIFFALTAETLAAPIKYKTLPPPSADLHYAIQAVQKGIGLKGNGFVQWRNADGKYLATAEIRAMLLGKILEEKSEGKFDAFGLAPTGFTEKRMRKSPVTVSFNRDARRIQFSATDETYPIEGGEQDRNSITWQLASVARGAGAKFKPGSTWKFQVAGRKEVQAWTFKVMPQEKLKTSMGELTTMRVSRLTQDSKGQQIEIWLAPSQNWYPVKVRIAEPDGDYVEQIVESITKK
jgi:hypothetical protein